MILPAIVADRADRIQRIIENCIDGQAAVEQVSHEALLAAHPELQPELGEALRDLRFVQQAQLAADQSPSGGLRIRCPHCHHPIEIVDDSSLSDVVCPSCGSGFSLTDDSDRTFQASQQEMVNHFQLLDRVGVGAFGSVWSARDTQLDRMVALKIPRKGELSPEEAEQFIREARAAAQLKHPNIVSVLEVGRYKDRIYIACDFIQGLDLADWLTDHQATPREAAELCATLADALEHAHRHGVIHRDLKPSNIMLDAQGEPHLMDFGLGQTRSGRDHDDGRRQAAWARQPTCRPNRPGAQPITADARSDVYSLGVILFELLTGERPFRGTTRMLLHQVLVQDAPSPRSLNAATPRDLETICLKCLEKSPDKRYQTAGEMRDDLNRFIRGEPVQARPIRKLERGWRWSKRHPAHAAVIALVSLLAIVGPLFALRMTALTNNLRRVSADESEARAKAESANDNLRRLLYISDMRAAQQELDRASISNVVDLLERHRPQTSAPNNRMNFEWYYLWAACRRAIEAPLIRESSAVVDSVFAEGRSLVSFMMNGTISWRDIDSGRQLRTVKTKVMNATFQEGFAKISPDGKMLAIGMMTGLKLVNLQTGEEDLIEEGQRAVWAIDFSPDSRLVAFGDVGSYLTIWDTSTKSLVVPPIHAHEKWLRAVAFTPDGKFVATGGEDLEVKLWDVTTGKLEGEPFRLPSTPNRPILVMSLAFSSDGRYLAAGTGKQVSVRLWSTADRSLVHEFFGMDAPVDSLAFSPDNRTLAAAGHTVQLWDVATGRLVDHLRNEHGGEHQFLKFSSDGRHLACSTGANMGVRIWPLDIVKNARTISLNGILGGAISLDGTRCAAAGEDGRIGVWDTRTGERLHEFLHDRAIWALAFSRDGTVLASGGLLDGKVKLWDLSAGELILTLPQSFGGVTALAFSPDGRTLGCLDSYGKVVLWDNLTQETRLEFVAHERSKTGFAFSPDGKILATGGTNVPPSHFASGKVVGGQTVALWNVASGKLVKTIRGPQSQHINAIAFSSDGALLAFAGSAGVADVWTIATNSLRQKFVGHVGSVSALLFSQDNTAVISRDAESVCFWDLQSGDLRFRLDAPPEGIGMLGHNPDGSTLVTGGRGTIRIWNAASPDRVESLRERWTKLNQAVVAE